MEIYEASYVCIPCAENLLCRTNSSRRSVNCKIKGVLPDGMKITVKQIDEIVHDFTYKFNTYEFENEIKFPSTFRHPNLVRLLGHCTENNQHLLVYEYMENGSLSNALFGKAENSYY
ncbi:hypothetical protein MKX03_007112 [Papaver bracteatum]|nr:hypothetical protein MKX03_007112 [Papaver bracteatum]